MRYLLLPMVLILAACAVLPPSDNAGRSPFGERRHCDGCEKNR